MKHIMFVGLLLGLMFGAANAEQLEGTDVDRGYQRAGSDYANYHAKNARHCARDCMEESRCKAFDFNKYDQTCWLKDRANWLPVC